MPSTHFPPQRSPEPSSNPGRNHTVQGNDDEAEETLSLSDFQIHDNGFDCKESSRKESSFDEEFFGFFTEERSPKSCLSSSKQPENIILFGKLIPSRQPMLEETQKLIADDQPDPTKRLFKWHSFPHYKRSSSASKSITTPRSKSLPVPKRRGRKKPATFGGKIDIFGKRVSIFLGWVRAPARMDLGDMRSRLHRRGPPTNFRTVGRGDEVAGSTAIVGRRRGMGLWWWGLIRVLGCGGALADDVVLRVPLGLVPAV